MILSKPYGYAKYDRIDYAISKKIFPSILKEIPERIIFEDNLF